jgi:hypothetical protein
LRFFAYLFVGVLCAGCGGSLLSGVPAAQGVSTIAATAQQGDLLYVSDYESNDVYAYSYPQGNRVGVLAGILKRSVYPAGLCADAAGNLFVPDSANASVLEYAHGGTRIVAHLADANQYPYSCAVDPVTGNLAVVNTESFHAGGSVAVYARARGEPVDYSYPYVFRYYFAAYDDRGDLFVDGSYDAPSVPFVFLELPKGAKKFKLVTLDQAFRVPGSVAWDGRYLDVGDPKSAVVFRFSIRAGVGEKIDSVKLSGARYLAEFFTTDSKVVGASFHGRNVAFWKYPGGGAPAKRVTGFGEPFGVTLSKAPPITQMCSVAQQKSAPESRTVSNRRWLCGASGAIIGIAVPRRLVEAFGKSRRSAPGGSQPIIRRKSPAAARSSGGTSAAARSLA